MRVATTDREGKKFGVVKFVGIDDHGKTIAGYHLTSKQYAANEDMGFEWYVGVERILWPLNDSRFGLLKQRGR